MERYEMHARANSEVAKLIDELVSGAGEAFNMQSHDVQMPAVICAAVPVRNLDFRNYR